MFYNTSLHCSLRWCQNNNSVLWLPPGTVTSWHGFPSPTLWMTLTVASYFLFVFYSCSFFKSDSGGNCSRTRTHRSTMWRHLQKVNKATWMNRRCIGVYSVVLKSPCTGNRSVAWTSGKSGEMEQSARRVMTAPHGRCLGAGFCRVDAKTEAGPVSVIAIYDLPAGKDSVKISLLGTIRKNKVIRSDVKHPLIWVCTPYQAVTLWKTSDLSPFQILAQIWCEKIRCGLSRLHCQWTASSRSHGGDFWPLCVLRSAIFLHSSPQLFIPSIIFASETTYWMCVGK